MRARMDTRTVRSRSGALALASFVIALGLAQSSEAQGPRDRPPGTKVVRSGDHEAVLVPVDQARANLSPEERELLAIREEMRQLRTERREAMQRARDSGDLQEIERIQQEYAPRLDELRERVRESRDSVMEMRLRENPELAERLGARGEGRERFQCGDGPGQASDESRRRAFRRLQALAPDGSLADPADIPDDLRQELQAHARRVALLQCVRARARGKGDTTTVQRTRVVLRFEQQRHERAVRELLGAPPLPERPARRGEGAPADEAAGGAPDSDPASPAPGAGRRAAPATAPAEETE